MPRIVFNMHSTETSIQLYTLIMRSPPYMRLDNTATQQIPPQASTYTHTAQPITCNQQKPIELVPDDDIVKIRYERSFWPFQYLSLVPCQSQTSAHTLCLTLIPRMWTVLLQRGQCNRVYQSTVIQCNQSCIIQYSSIGI